MLHPCVPGAQLSNQTDSGNTTAVPSPLDLLANATNSEITHLRAVLGEQTYGILIGFRLFNRPLQGSTHRWHRSAASTMAGSSGSARR